MGHGDTNGTAPGRKLGGGAIASLAGVGWLLVFVLQNRQDVGLDFLVWTFTSAALAAHHRLGVARGVGVVRNRRDAPSSTPRPRREDRRA